jgi:hypothetical protein
MKKPLKKNKNSLAKNASHLSNIYNTIRNEKKMRGGISDELITTTITPFLKDHSKDIYHLKYELLDKLCDDTTKSTKYDKGLKDLKAMNTSFSLNPKLYSYNTKDFKTDNPKIKNLLYILQLAKSIYLGFKKLPSETQESKEISSDISRYPFNIDYIPKELLQADTVKKFEKVYKEIKEKREKNPEKPLPTPLPPTPPPTPRPIKQDPEARTNLLKAALILSNKIVLKHEGEKGDGDEKEKDEKEKDEKGKQLPDAKKKWPKLSFFSNSKTIIDTLQERIEKYNYITKKLKDIDPFKCLEKTTKKETITYKINKDINLTKALGSGAYGTVYLTTIYNGFGNKNSELACKIMEPILDNKNEIKINEWITQNLLLKKQSKHFALTYKSTECITYDNGLNDKDRLVSYIELFEGNLDVLLTTELKKPKIDYPLIWNILYQAFICIATYQNRVGLFHQDTQIFNFLYQQNSEIGYYHYKYNDTEFYIKSCMYNIIINDFGKSKKYNDKKLELYSSHDYLNLISGVNNNINKNKKNKKDIDDNLTNVYELLNDIDKIKYILFTDETDFKYEDIFNRITKFSLEKNKEYFNFYTETKPKDAKILNENPYVINKVTSEQAVILNIDNSLNKRVERYNRIILNSEEYLIDIDDMYYPIQNKVIKLNNEDIRNYLIQKWITDNLVTLSVSKHFALTYINIPYLNIRDNGDTKLINYTEKCNFNLSNLSLDDNEKDDENLIMNMLIQAFICIATYHNMVGFCYPKITANNFLVQTNDYNGYYYYKYNDTEFYIKSCKYNIIIDDFSTSEIINEKSKVQIVKNYFEVLTIFIDNFKSESINKKLLAIQLDIFGATNVQTINKINVKNFTFEQDIIDGLFSKKGDIYLATNTNNKLNILNIKPTPFIIKTTDQEYLKKLTMLKSNVRTAVLTQEDYGAYEEYNKTRVSIEENIKHLLRFTIFKETNNDEIRSISIIVDTATFNNKEDAERILANYNNYLLKADNQNKKIRKLEDANAPQQEINDAYTKYKNDFDFKNKENSTIIVEILMLPQAQTGGNPPKYKSTGNTVIILYKKKKYKRTIYVKDKRKAKYCKINNEYILLSKLKIIT